MNRILLLCLVCLALFSEVISAQNTITIHQKDGQKVSFGFAEKPVVTYTDNYLVVKTTGTEMQYPLLSLSKITFSDTPTSVTPVADGKQSPVIEFDGYAVNMAGVKANASVTVFSSEGKAVSESKADAEGLVSISLEGLPQDVYLIKAGEITFKVLKK